MDMYEYNDFEKELEDLINKHGLDTYLGETDRNITVYLIGSIENWKKAKVLAQGTSKTSETD